ncbi:nucleotide exchange factor GrpE [uncultured Formosa sp.]|uniref:nucleotide exchange factor GrpE n=1 Tax=uncultured Formosa sp. TaxID=255435 RepID=UPI002604EAE2|nr:nucleotide exchange factor GrpE [uncultured Formosa sp.]
MSKEENQKDIEVENIEEQVEEQVVENQEVSVEEDLQAKLKEEKDKFLRLFAEFENYKKRTSKERIDLFKTANKDVMVALLPVLDDFDRAYSEISKTKEKDLLKGVELISNKLKNLLQSKGLELVEVEVGDTFNADHHEAITQIPSPTPDLKGKIIDVIEKGYKLGETVIRFPKVVIGQ